MTFCITRHLISMVLVTLTIAAASCGPRVTTSAPAQPLTTPSPTEVSSTTDPTAAPAPVRYAAAVVIRAEHYATRVHNVVDLQGTMDSGQPFQAAFLSFYRQTGAEDRWGEPLSEAFVEDGIGLTQYFERGVMQFTPEVGVAARPAVVELLRVTRPSDGSPAEVRGANPRPGGVVESDGAEVSDRAVDGTVTGFRQAFDRFAGVTSLGQPLSESRPDVAKKDILTYPGINPGPIRQYFEAAVLEHAPDSDPSVRLLAAGEALREQRYPELAWLGLPAFRHYPPGGARDPYPPELLDSSLADAPSRAPATLVGRSRHGYALAYHPQPHLFYADGWYALYYDGDNAVVAYSTDGIAFDRRTTVSHRSTAAGVAMYYHRGTVYLLYPDSDNRRIFLRIGVPRAGTLALGAPLEIVDMQQSFRASVNTLAFDPEGRPIIVFRSFDAQADGSWQTTIWLTAALDATLRRWTSPAPISMPAAGAGFIAGMSGAPGVVSDHLLVVYGSADSVYAVAGPLHEPIRLRHARLDEFTGVHDVRVLVSGDQAHVAYRSMDGTTPVMRYRTWTADAGWSAPQDLGPSAVHTTAMSVDGLGNVWVFYGGPNVIAYRVKRAGRAEFDPPVCAVAISELDRNGLPWLASSQPSADGRVALLWTVQPGDAYEVRFHSFDHGSQRPGPGCPI
jgi:hypothetical protein